MAEEAGREVRRRERAVRNDNPSSERLCYFLRHHAAKDRVFANKGQPGGWFKYVDVLPWFRNLDESQLDAVIASSRSFIPPHALRFETKTEDSVKWARARYGHSFDTTLEDVDRERSKGEIPTLTQLLIERLASDLPNYLKDLNTIHEGWIITSLFHRYKTVTGNNVSNKVIKFFLLPQVSHLDFKGLIVEDSIIRFMVKECTNLMSLSLEGCFTCMTDTNLQYVVKRCPELRFLDISGCRYLTDAGLSKIPSLASNLSSLSLRWLKVVNREVIRKLASSMPQLEILNVTGCPMVHPAHVEELRTEFPNLYLQYDTIEDIDAARADELDTQAEEVFAHIEDGADEEN